MKKYNTSKNTYNKFKKISVYSGNNYYDIIVNRYIITFRKFLWFYSFTVAYVNNNHIPELPSVEIDSIFKDMDKLLTKG